jgi:allantoin racemase
MIRVHIIIPTVTEFDMLERLQYLSSDELQITQSVIPLGPASIESEYDELLAGPGIVIEAINAERDGADAVIIACVGDPGLHQAREAVSIPVVGPGELAMYFAAMCGRRFSIISTLERRRGTYTDHARHYGLGEKLASVLAADIPVLAIDSGIDVKARLLERALTAIEDHGADVIVLACAGFSYLNKALQEALAARGHQVPVIDVMPLAVTTVAAMVKVGLSHSKKAFPFPPAKTVKGYGPLDSMDW